MSDINDACEALAATISSSVEGLYCKPYLDDTKRPPEAQITTRAHDPRFTFTGTDRVVALRVRVFVRRADPRAGQELLRNYMTTSGEYSLKAAIEDADNWDGEVHSASVTEISDVLEIIEESAAYLAVDFDVDLII